MPTRRGNAKWQGNLPDGNGTISVESGVLEDIQYSFKSRFQEGKGTNPEELIAGAHAGCFSMALAHALAIDNYKPESIKTDTEVILVKIGDGFEIQKIILNTIAKIPNIAQNKFVEYANEAKVNCPVSKALKAVDIELNVVLNP